MANAPARRAARASLRDTSQIFDTPSNRPRAERPLDTAEDVGARGEDPGDEAILGWAVTEQ